ncbi:MAG TPA: trypsin-like peptidase domain-containing protein, partial [bacterium]|nr:trypsin-like peptidase domain-containing protein [bacterium]
MRRCLFGILILFVHGTAMADPLRDSLVKIFVTQRQPDYTQPWQMKDQESMVGSGFAVAGQNIITCAHLTADAVNIQVRKADSVDKYQARLVFLAPDSDLAVLRVDDPAFWDGMVAAKWGGLPRQGDKVAVYGFPVGGDDLSVSDGVVSRVGERIYPLGLRDLLTLQVDAAINPGNSGGPVFSGDRVVGVCFQQQKDSQGIGYAVPIPIINRFLADIKKGTYTGVPFIGTHEVHLENPAFRSFLGLSSPEGGVYISYVDFDSSAWQKINVGDVILKIDGQDVASDGTIA